MHGGDRHKGARRLLVHLFTCPGGGSTDSSITYGSFKGPPCRSKFGFSALRSTHLKFSFQHSAPHISCRALLHVCSTHLFDVKVFALRSTHLHDISGFSTPLHTFCTPKLEPVFFFFSLYCCIAWQHPQTLDFDRAAWRFDRAAWRRLLRPASPAFLSFLSGLLLPPARPATPSTAARQLTADSWLRGF